MQTSERVVVVKGNAENWYSQAVFILNPGVQDRKPTIDFVTEAEKIIHDYMAKSYKHEKPSSPILCTRLGSKTKKRLTLGFALNILMGLACVGMAIVIGFGMLN